MKNVRLSPKLTALVHGSCTILFALLILICANLFRYSLIAIYLAGFLGSLVFFFLVVFIGRIYEMQGKKKKPGLIPISISLIFAFLLCFLIDPFCLLACFLFSIPMLIYLYAAAHLRIPSGNDLKMD